MKTVITGGAGFIAQALATRMHERRVMDDVVLVDRVRPPDVPGCTCIEAELCDPAQLARAVEDADRVIHLAALPGGAAEAQPAASRSINLDISLNLLEALGHSNKRARMVYASSIAVFGAPLPPFVDDRTPPRPSMTYGTHKLMVEVAFADAVRRGVVNGVALRLPGIVARPADAGGLKSAFISEVFHAIMAGRSYDIPVPPSATLWLLSSVACADALLHAADMILPAHSPAVMTLPALRVAMHELVATIGRVGGRETTQLTCRPNEGLTGQFGLLPPLSTHIADALGFVHDGDLERLVRRVLTSLRT